jgi:hypothetical protein
MTDTSDTTPQPTAPLSDWEMKAVAPAKLEAELFTLNKATLLNALTLAGVTRVVVSFDGYRDSGQIENVEAQTGHDPVTMPPATIEIAEAVWDQAEPTRSSVSIAEAVERLAYRSGSALTAIGPPSSRSMNAGWRISTICCARSMSCAAAISSASARRFPATATSCVDWRTRPATSGSRGGAP